MGFNVLNRERHPKQDPLPKSPVAILFIFGCGIIGTAVLVLTATDIANAIDNFVMTNFYHQTTTGKAFDMPEAQNAIGIGLFVIILGATIVLAPKILKKR